MTRLMVIGGSSGVGLACVKEALARGHEVRMFSRSASRNELQHDRLEKCDGNALDETAAREQLVDVDAVLQTLGLPLNLKLITGPVTLFSESTKVLLPAMRASGVKRLVALTGFGAGESHLAISALQRPGFKLVFGRAYDDKGKQERMITDSDLDWTIVRPGVLRNGAKTGDYRVLVAPDEWKNGIVRRADVADYMITAAESPDHIGTAPVVINHGFTPWS